MNDLDATFAALSDATRRAILRRLMRGGETRLSDLAAPFEMTQTGVSKHVKVLADAGLVVVEKRGRSRHCRLDATAMKAASEWLAEYESFWTRQFEQLGHYLAEKDD